MRAGLSAPFFGIIATLTGFLLFVLVLHNDPIDDSRALHVLSLRQATNSAAANTSPAAAASQTQAAATSQQQAATSNTPAAAQSSQQQQQPASTPTTQASAAQQSTTQAPAQTSNTPSNAASNSATPTPATVTSAVVTTNAGGQAVTSVVVVTDGGSAASSAPPPSSTSASSNSGGGGSSGISTSTIIGLSVAGGVALLCVAGFFVWKFTRKRLGDFDNNEEIKWPELNSHDTSVPLPTNRTGGSGFDTGLEAAGRSSVGYAPSTAANSTAELQPDPYAVPPLPHLDPNQPYHDDPTARFYDPYRGPIPPSFEQTTQGGEAIPMTQLAGRRSPGPGAAYGGDFGSGRASPGPHAAYGAAADIAGRASPAPFGADFGGRASPGPRAAYTGGRTSPGPQAAYGNVYGPR